MSWVGLCLSQLTASAQQTPAELETDLRGLCESAAGLSAAQVMGDHVIATTPSNRAKAW